MRPVVEKGEIRTMADFYSTSLGNARNIRIYLPPSYRKEPSRRFPVLYMHDGQGLFDSNPFSQTSWRIHETVDRLIGEGSLEEIIIVGIDNQGDERRHEFTFPLDAEGGIPGAPDVRCRGLLYERFLIRELKPCIDRTFRTLPDKANTGLMGSSLGGLVTYHIGFRNPDVFSKLGILSPYFVQLDLNSLESHRFYRTYRKEALKIWIDIGEIEANILTKHVRKVVDELIESGFSPGRDLVYAEVPEAAHTEQDWAERVQSPLLYLFGKVGRPVSVRLHGRSEIGLQGEEIYRMNPILLYDSGFSATELRGEYEVDAPDVLEVLQDGTMIAKKSGTANVRFRFGDMSDTMTVKVIDELSGWVRLSLRISVQEDGCCDIPYLHVGRLRVPKLGKLLYGGEFRLPRDLAIRFRIATDSGVQEAGQGGREAPFRILKLNGDTAVDYTVVSWTVQLTD